MSDAAFGIDQRWLMAVFLALATVFHFLNRKPRDRVDAAVATLIVPERRPSGYTPADLKTFRDISAQRPAGGGGNALDLYCRKVLTIDLGFAVCLAIFSYVTWDFVAAAYTESNGAVLWLSRLGQLMSIVYGVTDVGEDILLLTLLRPNRCLGKLVYLASFCTRAKMISLTCSVFGLVVFLGLWLADLAFTKSGSAEKETCA